MPVYTVHQPPMRDGDALSQFERFRFIRDGFAFWAMIFGPLWLLRHRLWLALIGYVIVVAALAFGLAFLRPSAGAVVLAIVLFAILFGLEANSLRRWTYSRRGWRNVGVVVGEDQESAERRFFDHWLGDGAAPAPAAPHAPAPARKQPLGSTDVIGLFPEPGGRV